MGLPLRLDTVRCHPDWNHRRRGRGFARFFSVLVPNISESNYIIAPIHISSGYAISLSTAQLVGSW